jgi:hypothetical protein
MKFLELAEKVLSQENEPLSSNEIWKVATNKGFNKELKSSGKTPWQTLASNLYLSVKDPESLFVKHGESPAKFSMKKKVIVSVQAATIIAANQETNDETKPVVFALENHLEEFLVANWAQTKLGREYDIYKENGVSGRQYQTKTGPLDILAVSKDKSRFLVVELKKGRASDKVIGQILRYMGSVKESLAKNGQTVEGIIITPDDPEDGLRLALSMTPCITFLRYQITFNL